MGFYLRKSVKAGPFRVNLSKSGLGVSTGIPGLRVGVGPRGSYVHMGRKGLYYRSTLRGPRAAGAGSPSALTFLPSVDLLGEVTEKMTVLDLAASTHSQLVDDLNHAAAISPLNVFAWLSGKRRVAAFYDVQDESALAFEALVEGVRSLQVSQGKWLVATSTSLTNIQSRKANAMASSLLSRTALLAATEPPKVLATNIVVPSLGMRSTSLHFLPDVLLVRQGKRYASWPYDAIKATVERTRFIEDGRVPSDSEQVGTTWQYANKSGGPDRRYNNNRQLPIMQYAELELFADDGLRATLQFSNVSAATNFVQTLEAVAKATVMIRERSRENGD